MEVTASLDQPYRYRVLHRNYPQMDAEARIGGGRKMYMSMDVHLSGRQRFGELVFSTTSEPVSDEDDVRDPMGDKYRTTRTGKGEAFRILATAIAFAREAKDELELDGLAFSAEKAGSSDSRARLYRMILRRTVDDMLVDVVKKGDVTMFYLSEDSDSLHRMRRSGILDPHDADDDLYEETYEGMFAGAETATFDKPYKWRPFMNGKGAAFNTDDGRDFEIRAYGRSDGENVYGVLTFTNESSRSHRSPFALTGEGDAFRIFATVVDWVKWAMEKHKWQGVAFAAIKDDNSRISLYQRMSRRFAKALGMELLVESSQRQANFYLVPRGPEAGEQLRNMPDVVVLE